MQYNMEYVRSILSCSNPYRNQFYCWDCGFVRVNLVGTTYHLWVVQTSILILC